MLIYSKSNSDSELIQILQLQQNNLSGNLTQEQMVSQGFVTLKHSFDLLKKLNVIENNIIVKDGNDVVGYVLAMTAASSREMPILFDMYESFNHIKYKHITIASYNYLVVGQVCISPEYRGKGVFEKLYESYKNHFKDRYDFAITEISTKNNRSKKAHEKVGFKKIHDYIDRDGAGWEVVLWDWRTS